MASKTDRYTLPSRARLVAGVRLLDPHGGSFHKYGGRWVRPQRWTEDGHIIVYMKRHYYLLTPEQLGLEPITFATQLKLLTFTETT